MLRPRVQNMLITEAKNADACLMERRNHDLSRVRTQAESETAVAVAERGLESWRAAKAAWLDSFAAFVAQEAATTLAVSSGPQRTR
jgi:hypothetical protein